MPSIRIFGRRWAVSSDDFVFPAATEAMIRFAWFVTTLCVYVVHPKDVCAAADHIHAYIIVALIQNGIVIAVSIATAYVSSLGTIRNSQPRRRLPGLLYARCPSILFEIIWNIVGAVWLSQTALLVDCNAALLAAARFTLVGSWLLVAVFFTGLWLVFDPLGNVHSDDIKMTDQAKRLWRWRLQLLCYCASGADNAKTAFEDVAELLTDFFKDTDLVLSDVWAGMLLLANRDLNVMTDRRAGLTSLIDERNEAAIENADSNEGDGPKSTPEWMNVRLASRMMEFSLGVYGWPYYVCGHGCAVQPLCDLMHRLRCCSQCRCDNVIVIKDNCCRCNTVALVLQTGIHETDLFYVNMHNEIWETPFVACLDHRTRSIVVAVRGSLSMRDAVTDLCALEHTLQWENTPDGTTTVTAVDTLTCFQVHKGMLWSARYIMNKLENEKVLDDLFVLQPEYDLVVTGHSLGAGVAALLSMLLRPKYANVRCFAFSPPGCVVGENAIPLTEEFICSVIVGDDLVPRLSMQSMERFRSNILDVLEHCDRPKCEILLKGCFRLLCARGSKIGTLEADIEDYHVENGPVSSSASPPNADVVIISERQERDSPDEPLIISRSRSVHSYTEERPLLNGEQAERKRALRCPGRIMHICKVDPLENSLEFDSILRRVSWRKHDYFAEVWLSSSMINDHLPYVVADVLREATKNHASVVMAR